MNIDGVRDYFTTQSRLSYDDLNRYSIDLLQSMIQVEIMKLRKEIPDCPILTIVPYKYTRSQLKSNKFKEVKLLVNGTYFSNREAITFYENGRIDVADWASGYNVIPFREGFLNWCDELSHLGDSSKK